MELTEVVEQTGVLAALIKPLLQPMCCRCAQLLLLLPSLLPVLVRRMCRLHEPASSLTNLPDPCSLSCAGTPYSARRRKTAFQIDTPRDLA